MTRELLCWPPSDEETYDVGWQLRVHFAFPHTFGFGWQHESHQFESTTFVTVGPIVFTLWRVW